MTSFLAFIGICCSVMMIANRERVADVLGEAAWMDSVGGVYNLVVILAVALFFLSVAAFTGTLDFFFAPVLWLLPGPAGDAAANVP